MDTIFLVLESAGGVFSNEGVWIAFLPAIAAAIPGIITAIAQIKDKKYKNLTELVETSQEENKKSFDNNKKLIEEIKKKLEAQDEIDELHREALKTLLREDIDDMYDLYYKNLGWMSEEDKDELKETYDIYEKLKGNHIGQRKYERMMALPEKEEDAHKD